MDIVTIPTTELRHGMKIANEGRHDKPLPVRTVTPCTRRGFIHVNANTGGRGKGGHGLCYDLCATVNIVAPDE